MVPVLLVASCGDTGSGRNQSIEEVAEEMAEVRIEPGQWEISTEITDVAAPGLPAAVAQQVRTQKTNLRQCVTPEQAERPDPSFFSAQQNSNCTYQDWNMRSGALTGRIICEGGAMPGRVVMNMEGEYRSNRYDISSTMAMSGNGLDMKVTSRVTGRRTGECPPV